mmetsp:Transcript_24732/g.53347  ORF Transcript_24732/g.53347 Transcript_24732/m.53347 type:complete len:574 (-) Transcript_24732:148-1869(-)|eukprot:CAMPEP_0172319292 /NCGR_PEP_ID=MMETSP1058-20130122/37295_1 /TAXON_ID=83371 /ORGANISM="Detonula confervacea, Strain CCMP 353" /LENGTH=573 /DNA_ID=CAMNT_0013034301 /DNA_START=24 /DNA_END=1745 /DNA_ORIENTATION=+
MVKLFNKNSKRVPSTVDLKMKEYDRLFAAKQASKQKGEKGKAISISVDGNPILELYPNAKLEDVQTFLNSLQEDINAKVAVVNDDEVFNRNADAVVQVVDDYEEKIGKSFRNLQQRLADDGYEEQLGKSFQDLQEGLAKGKSDASKKSEAVLAYGKVGADKVTEAATEAAGKVTEAVAYGKVGADKVTEAVTEAADKVTEVVEAAPSKVEALKIMVTEAVEEAPSKVAALKLQMGTSVRNFFSEMAPKGEAKSAPATLKEDEVEKAVVENEEVSTSTDIEVVVASIAVKAAATAVSLNEAAPYDEQSVTGFDTAALDTALDTALGAALDTADVADGVSSDPSIEAVEQDGEILLAFYEPLPDEMNKGEVDEEGEIDMSAAVYNLSLVIDGAVVQTLALSAAAMQLLNCSICNATEGQELNNHIIVNTPQMEECGMEIQNDLSKEGETPKDASAINDQGPEEQTFVHPMILDKLNEFLEQVKAQYEQISPSDAVTVVATGTTTPSDNDKNPETIQQSWFNTTVLKKQMSSFFGSGNTNTIEVVPTPKDEDNRNDCNAEVSPVSLNNEEVRQEIV